MNLFFDSQEEKNLKVKEKLQDLDSQTDKLFGLVQLERFKDYNTYCVELKTLPGYIFTLEAGFDNTDILVIAHGFGMSSLSHIKMLPELTKHFHVYAFDLYGMGASYRHNIEFKANEDAIDTMILSIEEWRQQLKIDNFYIQAHSLGAFLTNHYLIRYKPNVKGIFMLSPGGMSKISHEQFLEYLEDIKDAGGVKKSWFKRKLYQFSIYQIFFRRWSPFILQNILPNYYFINRYFSLSRQKQGAEEAELLTQVYMKIYSFGTSSYNIVSYLQKYGRYSDNPWINLWPEQRSKYNYVFLYGYWDWMDHDGKAKSILNLDNSDLSNDLTKNDKIKEYKTKITKNPKAKKLKSSKKTYLRFEKIENCGHQIPFENPEKCVEQIINHYLRIKNQ